MLVRLPPRLMRPSGATYHDDVVISMFLQDIKRVDIYRLGGGFHAQQECKRARNHA